jgi:DNA-binding NtrC family response regulator
MTRLSFTAVNEESVMSDKVLLVDDDPEFLEVMCERLKARGTEVHTANSAAEALELIDTELFDAVILDLQMPGIDGIDTLKRIKEKREELQVILLTGHGTVEKAVESIKIGAMDFLEKPADFDALNEKIKKAKKKKLLVLDEMNKEKMMEMLRRFGI